MTCTQLASIFSRRWAIARAPLLTVAMLAVLAAPSSAPAQDAGVSGIPPGPGNARGFNGSVNDPSGMGNAAKVPAIPPPPTISPVTPPALSTPVVTRTVQMQRAVKTRRTHVAATKHRRPAVRTTISEQERMLDARMRGICRGC
jgi:hypothetical protein